MPSPPESSGPWRCRPQLRGEGTFPPSPAPDLSPEAIRRVEMMRLAQERSPRESDLRIVQRAFAASVLEAGTPISSLGAADLEAHNRAHNGMVAVGGHRRPPAEFAEAPGRPPESGPSLASIFH
jgi:hypothetical protein